jgi:hypothetical protein
MQGEKGPASSDFLTNSDAGPVTPAPLKFTPGALKDRLTVPDNFLDPDPELESLFNDGQILSGVPDEELIKPRPDPPEADRLRHGLRR